MADKPVFENNDMENQENDDMIELTDQDGETTLFEHLATFPYKGKTYLAVCEPSDDEEPEDLEVFLLRAEEDENGEEIYVSTDDEETDEAFDYFLQLAEQGELGDSEEDPS